MKILVTGGAGFIGSHLVERLASQCQEVIVIDDLSRGRIENLSCCLSSIRLVRAGICERESLADAMGGVSVVYHLAAEASVLRASSDLERCFETNVVGTYEVLRAARIAGVRRVVFASSREVYGEPAVLPVSEDAPLQAKNPYGASKVTGELWCEIFGADLETVILRLSNVYGPRDRDRVIPAFLELCASNSPILLFGGDQVLDLVWIHSVVDAMVAAGTGPKINGPMNIGSGTGVSIVELAREIIARTGSASEIKIEPPRSIETVRFVANIDRATRTLGFPFLGGLAGLSQMLPAPLGLAATP
ncbi:MAG: NAD-dependent epimerase/dehydratase family protein [Acidobacteriota bacterium]|nr:NAD-dependent epimerase/dehydratase family protein [Acidobacteriota bacterium]